MIEQSSHVIEVFTSKRPSISVVVAPENLEVLVTCITSRPGRELGFLPSINRFLPGQKEFRS